jgi:hypothetical protein
VKQEQKTGGRAVAMCSGRERWSPSSANKNQQKKGWSMVFNNILERERETRVRGALSVAGHGLARERQGD